MIGRSTAIDAVLQLIARVAPTEATVLVCGESGSGKELVARSIHESSARSAGPFVAINCGALPPTLIESELFGYEKGSFTGAVGRHLGYFVQEQRAAVRPFDETAIDRKSVV